MKNLNKSHQQISKMFDQIAPKYDFLNHLLSFNIDKIWRRKLRKICQKYPITNILDIATGTGDLAIELSKINNLKITGIDISTKMLDIAKKKIAKKNKTSQIDLILANSSNLPFADNSFDAATCAFGVRNFENLNSALTEIFRVIKNDGLLIILEFTIPQKKIFSSLFKFYFKKILPIIGKIISKNSTAYNYLPDSVLQFPQNKQFMKILEQNLFKPIKNISLSQGIASIYIAKK
mgnify:CR=1 FL=1